MNRKKFLQKSLLGLSTIVALPGLSNCSRNPRKPNLDETADCKMTPTEIIGPFPNKNPAELVKQNIISDRLGIPLLINFTVIQQSNNCLPLENVLVDVWQCDAEGNYSQYGNQRLQPTDYRDKNFLRGQQTTDRNGKVSFISIFPGWYKGRAPHIHVEVLDNEGQSIHATQLAFPKDICDIVYATENYNGVADTLNEKDQFFSNSLEGNLLDTLNGNVEDGYVMEKTIVV